MKEKAKCLRHFFKNVAVILLFIVIKKSALSQAAVETAKKGAKEATLPVVVLPSPNSAVLTRQVSEHADLYTGKLSVEIPLFNLKSRNIELPISLQSSVNAHKVDDIGSWAGIGWHLNAGGMITRVMKSLPDEYSVGISGNRNISPSFSFPGIGYLSLSSPGNGNLWLYRFEGPLMAPYPPFTINEMKDVIHKGSWNTKTDPPPVGYDLHPDEFYFNFGRHSGKFVFSQDGSVIMSLANNLTVIPTIVSGKITSFVITTDDGYKYEFGTGANSVEEIKLKVKSKSVITTNRYAGFLKNMSITVAENVAGDPVQFVYNGQSAAYTTNITANQYVYESPAYAAPVLGLLNTSYWTNTPNSSVIPQLMDFTYPSNTNEVEYPSYPSSWLLSKITSPTGDQVVFNYLNNGTLTYTRDRSFTANDPAFDILQNIGLGYTADITVRNTYGMHGGSGVDAGSLTEPKWICDAFPSYTSFGDRTISTSTVELASCRLKEIIAGNGTKVEFVANTSRLDFDGDKRLDKIIISINGQTQKEFNLDYQYGYNNLNFDPINFTLLRPRYYYNQQGAYDGCGGEYYTVSEQTVLPSSARYRMYLNSITEVGQGNIQMPPFKFEYFNKDDLPFRTSFNQDLYGYAKDGVTPPATKLLVGVLKSITYPTGGIKEFNLEPSGNTYSSNGLRIKEITEKESATASPIVKTYTYGTYTQSDWAQASYKMPDIIRGYTNQNNQLKHVLAANKLFSSSGRINPEMQTRGAVGGYDFVEVNQPGNGKYKIEFYTTNNFPDTHTPTILVSGLSGGFKKNINDLNYWYPFPQNTSNDWKRGLPIAEYWISNDGKKIKSTHYEYDQTSYADTYRGALGVQTTKYRIDYGTDWNWLMYGKYTYSSYWQLLKSKKDRTYHSDGISYIEDILEIDYKKSPYNGKDFLFQSQVKQPGNSKNEQVVQNLKYPLDYNNTTDAFGQGISQMKSKNVLNAIIEKYQYIQDQSGNNKRYIGGVLNKFHTDKPLLKQSYIFQPPTTISSFTESNTNTSSFAYDPNYKSAMNFNSYDTYGNILERNEEGDMRESYIWDHNNTYPVAKVSNASLSDVAYSSFEADGKGAWVYDQINVKQNEKGVTGSKYYEMPASTVVSSGTLNATKKYKLTFWSKYVNNGPRVIRYISGGGTEMINPSQSISIDGWNFYEVSIENAVKVEIIKFYSTTLFIDELRLFPTAAQMITYTYDPLIGMTSQCDANNRIAYYEYDSFGRLSIVRDQEKNILKKFCYNYSGQPVDCNISYNAEKTQSFTKVCPSCTTPSSIVYTVPANKYISTSQVEADAMAQNEIDQNGQNYANQNGTCTPVSPAAINSYNSTTYSVSVSFFNTSTYITYDYTAPAGMKSQAPTIPCGNYNITMSPGVSGSYYYNINGYGQYTNGTANFYNIPIGGTISMSIGN